MKSSAEGLDVIDCTGIDIAEASMPAPQHVPTEVTAGTTPLPVYPTQSDKDGTP